MYKTDAIKLFRDGFYRIYWKRKSSRFQTFFTQIYTNIDIVYSNLNLVW